MPEPWFRARRYGLGWSPANGVGTAVTLAAALAMAGAFPAAAALHAPRWAAYAVIVASFAALLILAQRKGDGRPVRWRWGDED
jgi:hypothetical protein